MTFRLSNPTLALLLLGTMAPLNSHAFQNGNTPQPPPPPAAPESESKSKSKSTEAATAIAAEAPMPFKWPIVGTLPDFMQRGGVDALMEVHEGMYNEYGRVYRMSLLGDDEIVFSDPRVFDQILRKEGKYPIGGAEAVTNFRDYYEENEMEHAVLSLGRGPSWKDWRKTMSVDMFVLWETYLPTIADTCSKITKVAGREVTEEKTVDMQNFLSRSAFDMFCSVMYGESPETTDSRKATEEDIEFVKATKKAFDITGSLMSNPLEKVFGGDLYKDFVKFMDKSVELATVRGRQSVRAAQDTFAAAATTASLDDAAPPVEGTASSESGGGCPISAIQNTITGNNNGKKSGNHDVPTQFLNPSYIERLVHRGNLNEDVLAELQGPLLMAGVDTTAYALSWFFLNMASNPDVQRKLAEEFDEKLGGADLTTAEQMDSLTYMLACFRESHRLTPSAPLSIKKLEEPITVVSGGRSYTVPAEQRMSLNLRGLPMDPALVEDPHAFRPERFSEEAVAARKGTESALALDHPYFNDPFGRGKRRCLGANIAKAEMYILAARLLQDWEISMVNPEDALQSPTKTWTTKQKLMLIADPYPAMAMTPRESSSKKKKKN
mmetsp:Transcript_13011/g.30686  ORF Transcript_13011/g.30686 Transcript_13011/m.30686 type:complete len:607 (+) Transcript_13011:144-1964(+)|eukprot:CAMPEP_0197178898 /NCGR_PEP_ID=MMETSP1423-20130617/4023_1 /TAXON_ID=476441 /ORGANISM="Pseudo-nitzschia heimii, Strain UNC1101" /LENGTH=606 /DNA_ID=CAMNT_0042628717 /DNA_START=244 /DNA_END=2064 /DNA_ORIENTATION=+